MGRREKPKKMWVRTELPCPACKGKTVNRDTSPMDGYYVQYCYGGVIRTVNKQTGKPVVYDCVYFGTGWEKL